MKKWTRVDHMCIWQNIKTKGGVGTIAWPDHLWWPFFIRISYEFTVREGRPLHCTVWIECPVTFIIIFHWFAFMEWTFHQKLAKGRGTDHFFFQKIHKSLQHVRVRQRNWMNGRQRGQSLFQYLGRSSTAIFHYESVLHRWVVPSNENSHLTWPFTNLLLLAIYYDFIYFSYQSDIGQHNGIVCWCRRPRKNLPPFSLLLLIFFGLDCSRPAA